MTALKGFKYKIQLLYHNTTAYVDQITFSEMSNKHVYYYLGKLNVKALMSRRYSPTCMRHGKILHRPCSR